MAQLSINLTHAREGDYKGRETDSARVTLQKIVNFLNGVSGAAFSGTVLNVSADSASGTVTLSGVGGTAASGTVTLGGGAGNVTIVTDGTSVGPVVFNTDDTTTAADWVTAANADSTFAAKATASSVGVVITITWDTKGTVGNSKTLTASRTAGTATASGATLSGGADGSVAVDVGSFSEVTNTTNLTDAESATLIASELNANASISAITIASADGAVVTITARAAGPGGNQYALASTSDTGTATASGAGFLTGGTTFTYNL